jgi:hypothetical protein
MVQRTEQVTMTVWFAGKDVSAEDKYVNMAVYVHRIKSCGQLIRSGLQLRRSSEGLTTPHSETLNCYEIFLRASEFAGSCEHGNELSLP